jgi:hypothetical protein
MDAAGTAARYAGSYLYSEGVTCWDRDESPLTLALGKIVPPRPPEPPLPQQPPNLTEFAPLADYPPPSPYWPLAA